MKKWKNMTVSKKLAWAQIWLIAALFIATNIGSGLIFAWESTVGDNAEPTLLTDALGTFNLVVTVLVFVVAILQCIYSTKSRDNSRKALVAGIFGIITLIPLVSTISLLVNILVIADDRL